MITVTSERIDIRLNCDTNHCESSIEMSLPMAEVPPMRLMSVIKEEAEIVGWEIHEDDTCSCSWCLENK